MIVYLLNIFGYGNMRIRICLSIYLIYRIWIWKHENKHMIVYLLNIFGYGNMSISI
jgi:hypothetical protein